MDGGGEFIGAGGTAVGDGEVFLCHGFDEGDGDADVALDGAGKRPGDGGEQEESDGDGDGFCQEDVVLEGGVIGFEGFNMGECLGLHGLGVADHFGEEAIVLAGIEERFCGVKALLLAGLVELVDVGAPLHDGGAPVCELGSEVGVGEGLFCNPGDDDIGIGSEGGNAGGGRLVAGDEVGALGNGDGTCVGGEVFQVVDHGVGFLDGGGGSGGADLGDTSDGNAAQHEEAGCGKSETKLAADG